MSMSAQMQDFFSEYADTVVPAAGNRKQSEEAPRRSHTDATIRHTPKRAAEKDCGSPGGGDQGSPDKRDCDDLLQQLRSSDTVRCFGGWLLRSTDLFGAPILRFVVKGMSERDVEAAEEHYSRMGRMGSIGMVHRTGSRPLTVGEYTVFDFEVGTGEKTIREHFDEGKPFRRDPVRFFAALVKFLRRYGSALNREGHDYRPLNCLSKETVLIDQEDHIKLIPLQAWGKEYPVEIPREVAAGEKADERSDLYAAAFLTVEVSSSGRSDRRLVEPDCEAVVRCLKAIRDCRPDLTEAMQLLCGDGAKQENQHTASRDYNGNNPGMGSWMRDFGGRISGDWGTFWEWVKEKFAPFEDEYEHEHPEQTDATVHDRGGFRNGNDRYTDYDYVPGDGTYH